MDHCYLCDCPVPSANMEQHENGQNHQSNKIRFSRKTSCDVFQCSVPIGGWELHVKGRQHRDKVDKRSLTNDEYQIRLHPATILYGQDSIANRFKDGTSLQEGIWNAMWGDHQYPLGVCRNSDGTYSAINNRTLYCYREAGASSVLVTVQSGPKPRGAYDDVKVRGGLFWNSDI